MSKVIKVGQGWHFEERKPTGICFGAPQGRFDQADNKCRESLKKSSARQDPLLHRQTAKFRIRSWPKRFAFEHQQSARPRASGFEAFYCRQFPRPALPAAPWPRRAILQFNPARNRALARMRRLMPTTATPRISCDTSLANSTPLPRREPPFHSVSSKNIGAQSQSCGSSYPARRIGLRCHRMPIMLRTRTFAERIARANSGWVFPRKSPVPGSPTKTSRFEQSADIYSRHAT